MRWFRVELSPRSAFGTPLRGDTLFGQLCWALRHRLGEPALRDLLVGYSSGRPFAVLSDAFPGGFVPRPELPRDLAGPAARDAGKAWKRRRWLPLAALTKPLLEALGEAQAVDYEIGDIQAHNSLRRDTAATGTGAFAPFQSQRHWYKPGTMLDLHIVHDPDCIAADTLSECLADIGKTGYGRDASTGVGRFSLAVGAAGRPDTCAGSRSWASLAPTAPQGGAWETPSCLWRPMTRFGRHGDVQALGNPFKNPILLADTGALLTPTAYDPNILFAGAGLGGNGTISAGLPETVHQGYAPVIPVSVDIG
jgi:CRISPR-associated protein Csm4